jgi:hypothetical protein
VNHRTVHTQPPSTDQQAAVLAAEAGEVAEEAIQAHGSIALAGLSGFQRSSAGWAQAGLVTLLGRQALQRSRVDLRVEAPAGFVTPGGDAALVALAA